MKLLRNLLLTVIFTVGLAIGAEAQSGWSTGNYYAYQGESRIDYTYNNEYNFYCNCYVTVRYCRQLNWYQEYHSGYVYVWGPNGWYTQWQEGYFWYCTWTGWYVC